MCLVFCLEIFYFAFYTYVFSFVLVSTLCFTLNKSSFCRALAYSMYSETATRDILRFRLPSSGHILVLVHSTLAAGNCIQMFYLYSFCKSPLLYQNFFPQSPVHAFVIHTIKLHLISITPILKVMQHFLQDVPALLCFDIAFQFYVISKFNQQTLSCLQISPENIVHLLFSYVLFVLYYCSLASL